MTINTLLPGQGSWLNKLSDLLGNLKRTDRYDCYHVRVVFFHSSEEYSTYHVDRESLIDFNHMKKGVFDHTGYMFCGYAVYGGEGEFEFVCGDHLSKRSARLICFLLSVFYSTRTIMNSLITSIENEILSIAEQLHNVNVLDCLRSGDENRIVRLLRNHKRLRTILGVVKN